MFYKIYIELSDYCGLNCSFCTPLKHKRGVMDIKLFSKIINEIKNKTKLIALHILGDPLYIQNLQEYIKVCEINNMKVDIVTSGLYLRDFYILDSKAIHQVSFSLDAMLDKNNFNQYSKYNSSLEKLLDFCKFRDKMGLDFFINFRMFNKNILMINKILKYFTIDLPSSSEENAIRLGYKIFLRFHKKFNWNSKKNLTIKTNSIHCYGSIKQLGILSDGRITPCCICANGEIVLGDIKINTFQEIVLSNPFTVFQNQIRYSKDLHEKCRSCSFRGL